MSANRVLFDEPGPKGLRRIRIATIASLILIALVIYVAIHRFSENGQLTADKWNSFLKPGIPAFIWHGLQNTLKVAGLSAIFAFPLGAVLALVRLSHNRALRWMSTTYIEFFRSTPLLLLIYVFFLALPPLGMTFPSLWMVVIPVVLCNTAVLAEIYRAGVRALPKGQGEAGLAIGLTNMQNMRFVILPQAIRIIIPSLVTQLVSLLKDSTLAFAVSYPELMKTATNLTARYHNFIQTYLVIALIFVTINVLLSYLARVLDRRLSRTRANSGGNDEDAPQEPLVMPMETAPGGGIMR
jgi:glutamate transport system permease protein